MKKLILPIAIMMLQFITSSTYAQPGSDVAFLNPTIIAGYLREANIAAMFETKVTKVNIKAARDFSRSFNDPADVKWYSSPDGFSASFDSEGVNTKVLYDKKGRRIYSIKSYTENKLDRKIRTRVRRNYFDDTIIGVHQFEFENNKTVYVIKMLGQNSQPKTLTLCDGLINDITTRK